MGRTNIQYDNKTVKKFRTIFIDFYAQNHIWFKTVGSSQYGYKLEKIIPAPKEKKIDETFSTTVSMIKKLVIESLEDSVRSEIRHFQDCFDHNLFKEKIKLSLNVGQSSNLEKIRLAFSYHKYWDRQYGGKRWAEATKYLISLKNSKNIKDDIYFIDRIFDLQHNTGFILNKTNFTHLEDRAFRLKKTPGANPKSSINALNFRFRASLEDLIDNSSITTKKLYFANKNYI